MTANTLTARSPIPQFVCQSCGVGLQQDPSLDTLDDQLVKPNVSSTTINEESYNEMQQGEIDNNNTIRKTLGGKRLSQSSIDSTNGFAFVPHVPHDVNKDLEQKSMRDLRNDIMKHEKFYDFLSEQYTFDHPLCDNCAHQLLNELDQDLQTAQQELSSYKNLLEQLNSTANRSEEDHEKLQQELNSLDTQEKELENELQKLEQDNIDVQHASGELAEEVKKLEAEEIELLKEYNEQKRLLFEAEDKQKSIDNQIKYASSQYEKLSKTNAFNAAFHIWHQEHFGTINGFRLGRLPSATPVEWSEINAGLGQAALLLNALAKRIDLQFTKYRIVPLGSHSYIEVPDESKPGKYVQLPLYSGKRRIWDTGFDKAMIAFLDCVNQFKQAIDSKNQLFRLPYKMNEKGKGIITDNNGYHFSVSLQAGSLEEWTKALKYMLTNLKWGLSWISSQLPDDMTTSNTIPSTRSPTTTTSSR